MFRPGQIHRAELRDLPGAGPWTIHGTALILSATTHNTQTRIVTALRDHPDLNRPGVHTAYAHGVVYHGECVLHRVVTPDPGPATISLGPAIGRCLDTARLAEELGAAWDQLSDLMPDLIPDGPLGEAALGRLDRAAQRVADRRGDVRDALRDRDTLIARFVAGRVPPATVADRARVDRSRISQLAGAIKG